MAKPRQRMNHSRNGTLNRRVNVGEIRREQIVDAAAKIIADHGIQNLSLSEIESRTGMSRGQLTYYFPEKEQILLAVFDRTVMRMRQRVSAQAPTSREPTQHMAEVLEMIMFRPMAPEFVGLQYTFLAQTVGRADYRQRLASLYSHWRSMLMEELDLLPGRKPAASARTRASLFQAVAHGLAVQLVADPHAFDRKEMMRLCRQLFAVVSRAGSITKPKPKSRGRRRA